MDNQDKFKICPNCGNTCDINNKFCINCGTNIEDTDAKEKISQEQEECIQDQEEGVQEQEELSMEFKKEFKKYIFYIMIFLIVIFFITGGIILCNEMTYNKAKKAFLEKDITIAKEFAEKLPDNFKKYDTLKNAITDYENEELYKTVVKLLSLNDIENASKNAIKLPSTKSKYIEIKNRIKAMELIKLGDEKFKKGQYKNALSLYQESKNTYPIQNITQKINKANAYYKAQIAKLEESFIVKYDNVEEIKTYIDKSLSNLYNGVYLYIKVIANQKAELRFVISSTDFIFSDWDKVTFNLDSHIYNFNFNSDFHNEVVALFFSRKYVDLDCYQYSSLINSIISSKHSLLRLKGGNKTYDREISEQEKNAMRRTKQYFTYLTTGEI